MLEFIIGRAGSGKTTACLNTIKEKLIHSPTGKPLVILLPDHMTFAIERQLALELKDYGGFTRAYVLGIYKKLQPTRRGPISDAGFCFEKKKKKQGLSEDEI